MPVTETKSGICLSVKVIPRAAKNAICDAENGVLRVRINAPPADNAANETLCRFLARTFGVRPAAVRIVSGAASRFKRIEIGGIGLPEARRILGFGAATEAEHAEKTKTKEK